MSEAAMPDMADTVPLDDIERFLCGAGFSVAEILWADRQLASRVVTRKVFQLLRLHLFRTGSMTEMPAGQWNTFMVTRNTIRARRQSCLDRLRDVGIILCRLGVFRARPNLVRTVLGWLAPTGLSRRTTSQCMCLAPGCRNVCIDGVENFLDHLETNHV